MNTETNSERIQWVDMAKGFGIILLVLGHLHPGQIETWIFSFHMPLFFFLSGYCFHIRTPFSSFLMRKIKTMIIPYFALGVPIILFAWLQQWYGPVDSNSLLNIIKDYVVQRGLWDVWFLTCLFCLNIIYWVILVKIPSKRIQVALTVLMPIIGYAIILFGGGRIPLPWNMDVSLMAAPFFYAGFLFRNHEASLRSRLNSRIKVAIGFAFLFMINVTFCFLSRRLSGTNFNMFKGTYGIVPLSLFSSFAGIFCMIIIARRTHSRFIQYIGRYSLLYFAWQEQLGIPICGAMLNAAGFPWRDYWNNVQKLSYLLLQTFIIILMLTAANLLVTNTKLRFMVGK